MSKGAIAAVISAGLMVACVVFVVVLLLVKVLWAWTVPDLFPGAVQQNLVAAKISWLTAVKVAILVAVIGGIGSGGHWRTEVRGSARAS